MIKKAFAIGLALTMSVTSPMPVMADENMETQESVFDDSGDMDSIEEENSSEEQNGVNEFSSGDVNNEVEQDEQTDSEQEWSSGAEEDTFSATSDTEYVRSKFFIDSPVIQKSLVFFNFCIQRSRSTRVAFSIHLAA